ncbi:type I toxin-antitoxin system SymE family toxin [Niabella pedocola]|uniref:Type I toxin-antitoxin system SymE family toxin n=1 Tax=Niabella pedocola TaxID=1752077 RepID=A0ABS8PLZ2_9BACT|nr:SymE family type I addiction module toxin [Niabella pedocola]MCD2421253.1 type I toxin-antitoxin system SymE family toxin [Niabella pedocola]
MAIIATMKNSPAPPKLRWLKVYERIVSYNAGYLRNTVSRFPEIRLMGKWLADSGFMPGDAIRVSVEAGKLVITRDADGEEGMEAPAG